MLVYIGCEAVNSKRILASLEQNLSLRQCLKYAFIGFYFCAVTPSATGGQPAQIYYMKKDGIPISCSTLTLLINLAVFQTATLLCGIVFFCWQSDFILLNLRGLELLFLTGIVIYLLALAMIFAVIFSRSLIQRIFYTLIKIGVRCKVLKEQNQPLEAIERQLADYGQCVCHLRRHPRLLAGNFLITLLQLTCYFSVPYLVYLSFHLTGYSLWEIIAMQTVLSISVSALPFPGAVGVSEGSFLRLFHLFFGADLLLSAMVLTRGLHFYAMLILSSMVAIFTHWRLTKAAKQTRVPD